MRNGIGQKGFIKTLFVLAVLGFVITVTVFFVSPYYRYYKLGTMTMELLRTELTDPIAIKQGIMKDASGLGIKLNEDDITVDRVQQLVKVKARWKETVDLWGFYQQTFDFVMEEEY